MGKDLKSKFRIEFLSGTKDMKAKWQSLHEKDYVKYGSNFVTEDGYEISYIRAMIPTARVMDCWEWSNKTYNGSGMLIASADGEKYITKKDPVTMETIVKRGEPYTPFNYGDAISYNNGKKEVSLELKSSGKLKLFLPELGEFVSFELRTSSYIDSLNIQQNLEAIQQIADAINGGMAGGIPLDIYRVEQPVPYMGEDKKPHTSNQWFVQIKANSEWANQAIARLNGYAMGVPQLTAPIVFNPPALPVSALEEVDEEDGETPEKIISENVSEGVISENTQEVEVNWVSKIKKEFDSIPKENKPIRQAIVKMFREYEPSANISLVKEVAKLEECHNKLIQIKQENK